MKVIRRIWGYLWARLTLILLLAAQPTILTVTVFFRPFSDETVHHLVLPYCLIALALALHAAIGIRDRLSKRQRLPKTHKSVGDDIAVGAMDLLAPLIAVASVQQTFRKMGTIATDPESLRLLRYTPSPDLMSDLMLTGSFWALIIAYVMKYYWDDLIKIIEERRDMPQPDVPPSQE